MTWIPMILGLQVAFIYFILGRRNLFIARPAENCSDSGGRQWWRRLPIGFPMALILSLPVVIGLTLLDEWVRPVDLLEIAVVQGLYWLLLVGWTKRAKMKARLPEVAAQSADHVGPAPLPGRPAEPAQNGKKANVRILIERLTQTYLWDDIGTGEPFKTARKLPIRRLVTDADRANSSDAIIDAMRCVAKQTIALYRYGGEAATIAGSLSEYLVPGFDEYSVDVMQRLTYSALLERERLFIDQTDIEIFGEETVDLMYRLALFELRSLAASFQVGNQPEAIHPAHLQQSAG